MLVHGDLDVEFQIGMQFDVEGNPLIKVGGNVIGTVDQIKSLIERFEESGATTDGQRRVTGARCLQSRNGVFSL